MRIDPQSEPTAEPARPAPAPPAPGAPDGHGRRPHAPNGHAYGALHAHENGHGAAEDVIPLHPGLRDEEIDWEALLPEEASTLTWKAAQGVKRMLDFTFASAGLVVLSPLLLSVALLVRLTSRGPVFYACDYVGHRGRRFRGYKFRTMVADAEALKTELLHLNHMRGPAFKIRDDPRVTPLGRFLRKYSVDELPQLWNVVRGDMSLVGPRPPLPEEWESFADWQKGKLAVVPGITCTWQVNGRSEITDFDEWARLDLKYIRHWSLLEDLLILLRTIPAVLRGHGAY